MTAKLRGPRQNRSLNFIYCVLFYFVLVVAMIVTLVFIPCLVIYFLVILFFLSAMLCSMGLMGAWGLTYALSTYVQIMLGFGWLIAYRFSFHYEPALEPKNVNHLVFFYRFKSTKCILIHVKWDLPGWGGGGGGVGY